MPFNNPGGYGFAPPNNPFQKNLLQQGLPGQVPPEFQGRPPVPGGLAAPVPVGAVVAPGPVPGAISAPSVGVGGIAPAPQVGFDPTAINPADYANVPGAPPGLGAPPPPLPVPDAGGVELAASGFRSNDPYALPAGGGGTPGIAEGEPTQYTPPPAQRPILTAGAPPVEVPQSGGERMAAALDRQRGLGRRRPGGFDAQRAQTLEGGAKVNRGPGSRAFGSDRLGRKRRQQGAARSFNKFKSARPRGGDAVVGRSTPGIAEGAPTGGGTRPGPGGGRPPETGGGVAPTPRFASPEQEQRYNRGRGKPQQIRGEVANEFRSAPFGQGRPRAPRQSTPGIAGHQSTPGIAGRPPKGGGTRPGPGGGRPPVKPVPAGPSKAVEQLRQQRQGLERGSTERKAVRGDIRAQRRQERQQLRRQ